MTCNGDFVKDEIFSMFHIERDYMKKFIERYIDLDSFCNSNIISIFFGNRKLYSEKYFDFFFDTFYQEYYREDEDPFIRFTNKESGLIVYCRKDKDYRFENFIKDTNYRLYYKHKIKLFDYDKTIADLYERYYYLRIIILRDINLYGTSKVNYEECDRILKELAKEFKYPYKKNGFYDKFQLGRLGEDYI